MGILVIDGHKLKKAFIEGFNELSRNKNIINELNVFPVPDGDTGINMSMTVLSVAKEVSKLNTPNIYDISKAASNGALRGARGNSGVILSQLFRGFAKSLEGKVVANAKDIAQAFLKAIEMAYKAVMKPKEGTILTVARSISEFMVSYDFSKDTDIKIMLQNAIKHGYEVLKQTQYMLPELKQAGVVDAGGKGLLCMLQGTLNSIDIKGEIKILENIETNQNISFASNNISNVDIKFIYCTEFFINIKDLEKNIETIEEDLKCYLEKKGDSIVVVADSDIVKIHLHTNNPGEVLERALKIGEISNIKIENMKIQHTSIISFAEEINDKKDVELKEIGFVSVSSGEGINNIFKDLEVDEVIEGGQTMNPSTEDILKAVEKVNAKNIIILPNNSNIILAANQVSQICKNKNIYVIPSKYVTEGISALVNNTILEENLDLKEIVNNMKESIKNVKTGQVTYAVRDTIINELVIKKDDIISIFDDKIVNISSNIEECAKKLIDIMIKSKEDINILSIYYGNDRNEEDTKILENYIKNNYKEIEFEIYKGSQPLYYYIISIE